jgi:hypothetical protein
MELRVLNSWTLAESYRETNNEHTAQISFPKFNLKLCDNNKECVFNDKWLAIKMTSFY